jgi:hypothetical protein
VSDPALDRECATFTRYLTGARPTSGVVAWYVRAHAVRPGLVATDTFERSLLTMARLGGPATRAADAFARLFEPRGVLRRKLVVLLAVLEVTPPFAAGIDRVPRGGPAVAWLRLAASGLAAALAALVGIVILLPLRLVLPSSGRAR